jgi:hypothetical protein
MLSCAFFVANIKETEKIIISKKIVKFQKCKNLFACRYNNKVKIIDKNRPALKLFLTNLYIGMSFIKNNFKK